MQLTQNVGTVDRILRIVAGVSILGLALAGIPAAPLAWGTATVAVVLLVTGTTGFCPLPGFWVAASTPERRSAEITRFCSRMNRFDAPMDLRPPFAAVADLPRELGFSTKW